MEGVNTSVMLKLLRAGSHVGLPRGLLGRPTWREVWGGEGHLAAVARTKRKRKLHMQLSPEVALTSGSLGLHEVSERKGCWCLEAAQPLKS